MSILKKGMTGAPVKRMQEKLGIGADGVFGPGTEKVVKAFQEKSGLKADGIAGPDTFMAMGLEELVLLRVGTRGETVKTLQKALGLEADGRFGPATALPPTALRGLRCWQSSTPSRGSPPRPWPRPRSGPTR
jgi:peptidoglycan hydrolase-like protein with peptidoglycan-binding domain